MSDAAQQVNITPNGESSPPTSNPDQSQPWKLWYADSDLDTNKLGEGDGKPQICPGRTRAVTNIGGKTFEYVSSLFGIDSKTDLLQADALCEEIEFPASRATGSLVNISTTYFLLLQWT